MGNGGVFRGRKGRDGYPGASFWASVSACLRIASRPFGSNDFPRPPGPKPYSSKSTVLTIPPKYLHQLPPNKTHGKELETKLMTTKLSIGDG
jgi:hypothetical protein